MSFQVNERAKVKIHWKVSPYDYSDEGRNSIIEKASKKYGIPKDRIRVEPSFINPDGEDDGMNVTTDVINSIQDPHFQQKLFKEYLKIQKIEDYDFDLICKIDTEINGRIDYRVYDKYKRYSVKWLKWSNFLSYGSNNFFNLEDKKGILLLNSEPANQGGKTTLAVDVLHFLLFGKTDKAETLDKLFNKHIPEASTATVEGCLTIDGVDYIIKRTLTRPQLSRRTEKSKTNQTVDYYRVIGDSVEELSEYVENCSEKDSVQTNKVIKDAIGNEADFDLIMSVTDSTLDDLIEKKDADRGRLLARWIGLLPLEEKDQIARERFNQEIKPHLLSNVYTRENLQTESTAFLTSKAELEKNNVKYKKEIEDIDKDIVSMERARTVMLSKKATIDEGLMKLDITTLNKSMSDVTLAGQQKKAEVEAIDKELAKYGNIEFSNEKYDNAVAELNKLNERRVVLLERYKSTNATIELLKKSEYCPTCGHKLENVDNTAKIAENEKLLKEVAEEGIKVKADIDKLSKEIEGMKDAREKYTRANQIKMEKAALELNIEKLRAQYVEYKKTLDEFNKNAQAISENNRLDLEIRNTEAALQGKRNTKETTIRMIQENDSNIARYQGESDKRQDLIRKMGEEDVLVRNWKIYLEMVGKNGISKMVLRKALPLINGRLVQLLGDICDFSVEVAINNRNDVIFNIVKDGVKSNIKSGSGFEKTAAALSLRSVLGDLSTVPKNDFIVFDEVFGRVAKTNYDGMKTLIDKIAESYKFVIIISHIDEIKDWANQVVTIKKEGNISKIVTKKAKI